MTKWGCFSLHQSESERRIDRGPARRFHSFTQCWRRITHQFPIHYWYDGFLIHLKKKRLTSVMKVLFLLTIISCGIFHLAHGKEKLCTEDHRSRSIRIYLRWKSAAADFTLWRTNVNSTQRTTNTSQTSVCGPPIEMRGRIGEGCLRAWDRTVLQSGLGWDRHSGKSFIHCELERHVDL